MSLFALDSDGIVVEETVELCRFSLPSIESIVKVEDNLVDEEGIDENLVEKCCRWTHNLFC